MIGKVTAKNPEYLDPQYLTPVEAGVKILGAGDRGWQLFVLDDFADSRWSELVCPCGAGKSTAQVGLAIEDVIRSSRLQLFVVPQLVIASGFFHADGVYSTIKIRDKVYTVAVEPEHNFCSDSSLARLKTLLVSDKAALTRYCNGNNLSGLFAMTSYHALCLVWRDMNEDEKALAIRNLHLRLDESHHVAAGSAEEVDQNRVGGICRYMMESGEETCRITLSTATAFRGDRKDILAELQPRFKTFKLDWIEHWRSLGIESLDMEIREFTISPVIQLINNVVAEKGEKHYIAVPPRNAGWRKNMTDESAGVDDLIARLKAAWPDARINNLVRKEEQRAGKAGMVSEPKYGDEIESKYDVVVTCMLGREGLDWVPCSRLHVTYPEGSVTLAVQTLGRLLRRFPGKTYAKALYYYPAFPEPEEGLTKAELLDDRKNALFMMLQLEEMFFPIVLAPLPTREPGTTLRDHRQHHHMGVLETVLGSQAYIRLKQDFINAAIEQGIIGTNADEIDNLIDILLDDYDVPEEFYDESHDTLRAIFLRAANPMFRGMTVGFIREAGFKTLHAKLSDGDRALAFHHNETRMKEIRKIVQKKWDETYEEIKATIKQASDWDRYPAFKKWALIQKSRMKNAKAKKATV